MLLLCFLTCLSPNFFDGAAQTQLSNETEQASLDLLNEKPAVDIIEVTSGLTALDIVRLQDAMADVDYDLATCIGDHNEILFSTTTAHHRDIDSPGPIKHMLQTVHPTIGLHSMQLQMSVIVAIAQRATALRNKTTTDQVMQQMKIGFSKINLRLRDVERAVEIGLVDLLMSNYGDSRRKAFAFWESWQVWTASPMDVIAHKRFQSSCLKHNMADWFSSVKAMIANRPQFSMPGRRFIAMTARIIKSDMCEAAIFLWACDDARGASYHTKNKHVWTVIEAYEQFAHEFIELEKDVVANASEDNVQRIKATKIG